MRSAEDVEKLLDRMEALLNEYDASIDQFDREQFKGRNGEKLGKFEAIMKKLNGDDFDIYKESYDEYHSDEFKDMDENEYIDKLVTVLDEKLADLKDSLADGNVAEAAHIAEDIEEKAEETAETVDEEAHNEVEDEAEDENEKEEDIEKAAEAAEAAEDEKDEATEEKEEDEIDADDDDVEAELEKELANDKFRKAFL